MEGKRIALVTGANQGVGLQVAKELVGHGLTVLADVATSIQDLDRTKFAEQIAGMEAKLAEKEGSELDRAIERLDHFKSIQHELNTTAMH